MNQVNLPDKSLRERLAYAKDLGPVFAHSKMFGCQNEQQGIVLALACAFENLSPIEVARTYHIIEGNLSKKSDAMLAEFRERGGDHLVVRRTPDQAAVKLTMNGQSNTFEFSWEEAKDEPYVWTKKKDANGNPIPKNNWSTRRSRMQMLWARVVSDGVRAMCPEIVAGTYTPEEIQDFESFVEGSVIKAEDDSDPIETSGVIKQTPISGRNGTPTANNGHSSLEQRNLIASLFIDLQIPHDKQEEILQRRGVNTIRSLTLDAADELIAKLNEKKLDRDVAATAGESKLDPNATVARTAGPCTQVQISRLRSLIKFVHETDPDIRSKVVAKIHPKKLADLSIVEADALAASLDKKLIAAGFERTDAGQVKAEK